MKNLALIAFFLLVTAAGSYAQKYVFVDTKYVLEQIPEYNEAQEELNKLSQQWQEEIQAKYAEIEKRQKAFDAERILLPEETQKLRLAEIAGLEKEARELQKQYFGVEGQLFNKRKELIQPIQDKIFKTIKKMAKDNSYAFVFDKASSSNILYAEPKLDKSDLLLRKMGVAKK